MQVDDVRKQKAIEQWELVNCQLRRILRQGATACVQLGSLPATCKDKYFTSGMEDISVYESSYSVLFISTHLFMFWWVGTHEY